MYKRLKSSAILSITTTSLLTFFTFTLPSFNVATVVGTLARVLPAFLASSALSSNLTYKTNNCLLNTPTSM